jgi:hypothetical protein
MKNFKGPPFFSLFFIARAIQKIPNLALGRQSRSAITGTGPQLPRWIPFGNERKGVDLGIGFR